MAEADLKDRLRDHAKAFDGLLSLIPAKMYYGEEKNEEWPKKKQTKEQARAARRGKLDPDSELNRNAKEVMDERARNKRKLQNMQQETESDNSDKSELLPAVEKEKPGQGLKVKRPDDEGSIVKKQKLSEETVPNETESSKRKQASKDERRLAKKLKLKSAESLKHRDAEVVDEPQTARTSNHAGADQTLQKPMQKQDSKPQNQPSERPETSQEKEEQTEQAPAVPVYVKSRASAQEKGKTPSDSTPNSSPNSPIFDFNTATAISSAEPLSTASSVSSSIPPSGRPRLIKVPADTTALRARLAAKIEALRARRRADDKPVRNRQELIEERRRKEEQRKAAKREQRQKAKEEEERQREETLASSRNSPNSTLSPMMADTDDHDANHFAFGRMAFADGVQLSYDLSYEKSLGKKKGPSDAKTALARLEAQKRRIAGLGEDKRKEVLEKETWLAARKRAEGQKVVDDERLLKKTVKRKEKAKKKSEREWKDRAEAVEKSTKDRQRKREENIKNRREEKLSKGKGKKKGGVTMKKNRPGFEGVFGGRT